MSIGTPEMCRLNSEFLKEGDDLEITRYLRIVTVVGKAQIVPEIFESRYFCSVQIVQRLARFLHSRELNEAVSFQLKS